MAEKTQNKANTYTEATQISKSKAKREERRKEIEKEKQKKRTAKMISIAIATAIIALIVVAIGKNLYLAAIRTTPSTDSSAGLTIDGTIEGLDTTSAVTLADYKNLTPEQEITVTQEEIDDDIASTLTSYRTLQTESSLTAADGDELNIDFTGTIDGTEFEGGSSNDQGYDLILGSGSFIDDFEQQLIGSAPGDELTVDVTFPETYQSNPALAGKDASFAVTINGIYITPELTDDFVAENFTEEGLTTAAEYRTFIEKKFYKQHLESYLTNYIMDNSTINSYPASYVKAVKALTKSDDEYMMQLYSMYGMTYENVWQTRGEDITDELSYEKELTTRAQETVKKAMIYQAIFEKEGLSIDMEAVLADMAATNGEDYVTNMKETSGEGYMAQSEIKKTVTNYLIDLYMEP